MQSCLFLLKTVEQDRKVARTANKNPPTHCPFSGLMNRGKFLLKDVITYQRGFCA